ncbi:MAG: hypothetical protein LUF85_03910 [Bacteroides sp.]|nr:hypothetical protein [Bacteroides sp.]
MKKLIIILILIIKIGIVECFSYTGTISSIFSDSLPKSPMDSLVSYPIMYPLITSYYYYNLQNPENIQDLIQYVQLTTIDSDNGDAFWEHVKYLLLSVTETYQDKFTMSRNEDIFSFALKGNIIAQMRISTFHLDPCNLTEYVGRDPREYITIQNRFTTFRYYDLNNRPFLEIVKLQEKLDEKIRKLKITYLQPDTFNFFDNGEYTYPIYIVLEYRLKEGLILFCENIPFYTNLIYYKKLEEYLGIFCEEHSLLRIVFLSPEYQ